jgi:protein involved in polysaccharide export with SLBB domain
MIFRSQNLTTRKSVHALVLFAWGLMFSVCVLQAQPSESSPKSAVTNFPAAGSGSNATSSLLPDASKSMKGDSLANTGVAGTASGASNNHISATNSLVVLDNKYKLAIGDRLSFRIVEDDEDPKALVVTDSADVEVPYIGRLHAENRTCQELAAEIKTALEKDYYYQATVILAVDLMNKSHGRVYLVGAVRSPGPVEVPGDEVLTLSKAILRAGGFTDYADRRHVKVTRREAGAKVDKETFVTDVGEIFDKGKIETDRTLVPGDMVYVPDRLIRF